MLFLFLSFLSLNIATSFEIPAYVGRFGSPFVNGSIPGTFFENRTMPMRVTLESTTTIGHPRVPLGNVHVHTSSGDFGLADGEIYFHGGIGPESTLAIGRNSFVRNLFGPAAFTQNELVLNSNRTEFVSTCVDGSYMAIAINGDIPDQFSGSIHAEGMIVDANFRLGGSTAGIIGAFPREIGERIISQMIANGAVLERRRSRRGISESVMTNCSAESSFAGLPDVTLNFTQSGALVLTPEDYIQVDYLHRECILRFVDPAPASVGGYFLFNPLHISHLNVRVSDDLLEICDDSTA